MEAYAESWDLEGMLFETGGHLVFDMAVHYRKVRALRLTVGMVGKATLPRFMIGALLAGVPQSVNNQLVKEANEKIAPFRNDCLREAANNFGFVPKPPY